MSIAENDLKVYGIEMEWGVWVRRMRRRGWLALEC